MHATRIKLEARLPGSVNSAGSLCLYHNILKSTIHLTITAISNFTLNLILAAFDIAQWFTILSKACFG